MATSSPASERRKTRSQLRTFLWLFVSFLVAIGAAALAANTVQTFHQNDLREKITRDLTQKTQAFATRVNTDHSTKLPDLTSQVAQQAGARATVVDGNGEALADSQVLISALEKEGAQPEFVAALRGSVGVAIRSRKPFGVAVLYVAVPVPGGAVRLSTPLAEVETAAIHAHQLLLRGCAIAILGALLISGLLARITARP